MHSANVQMWKNESEPSSFHAALSQPGGARDSITISKCWAAFYLQRSLKQVSVTRILQTATEKYV